MRLRLQAKADALVYAALLSDFLRLEHPSSMTIADTHGAIERDVLGDGVLMLIEELPVPSVNMEVTVRAFVLVGLHRSVFCTPAELAGNVGVELAVERRIVTLMLSRRVDPLARGFFVMVLRA